MNNLPLMDVMDLTDLMDLTNRESVAFFRWRSHGSRRRVRNLYGKEQNPGFFVPEVEGIERDFSAKPFLKLSRLCSV